MFHPENGTKSGKTFGEFQKWMSVGLCPLRHCTSGESPGFFANFTPIFKSNNVGGDDISPIMKDYDERDLLLTQLTRMLIST